MNLALLIGRFPPGVFGGAEFQAEQWARRLAGRHHVAVVTRRNTPADAELESRDGFAIHRLAVSRVPLLRTALDLSRIERAVRDADPRPQLTLCFQTFVSGYAGVRIQRRLGIPAVVWVRGEDEYRLSRARTGRLSVPVWDEAAGVLVQSEANREHVLRAVRRFRPAAEARVAAKLEVVPNGIELPDAATVPAAGGGAEAASAARGRILAVGRLIHDKGMDVVVDAVAGMQGLLTVAGDGPERAALEARARRHGLDVRFEGAVPRARLDALYRTAQCVVLASRRGEGLPNVLIEAFACGRAVVATRVPGVTDLIEDGVNGLLVPPGDPLALRDALARLAHERGLCDRLGDAARETANAFAWERVLPRLEACLVRFGRTRASASTRTRARTARGGDRTAMTSRGRVCFFASYLWPSFSDGTIEFAGGAEVQQAALARGLAALGFEVSVATCDYGQGRRVELEGITFHATHPPLAGLPVLRFLHPRLSGNVRALRAAAADVIYQRGAGMQSGLALDVARWTGAGFVFAASHDHDARRDGPKVKLARDRWWYARAVRGADQVIAQTSVQQSLFRSEWGRESTVIPNLVELPAAAVDAGQPGAVLWLSTYKESKHPGRVVDLARRLPAIRFRMAGVIPPAPLTREVFERTRAAAAELPNLEVEGHIARADLAAFFSRGALFLHTSPAEGFPNTLLEAWAHGLPSVSMVDPDGLAARESLGEVAADPEAMALALTAWMGDAARRRAAGERARRFVGRHHGPEPIVERVAAVLDGVIQGRRRAEPHR